MYDEKSRRINIINLNACGIWLIYLENIAFIFFIVFKECYEFTNNTSLTLFLFLFLSLENTSLFANLQH